MALAPKYSDQQSGVLYEGMDYALLGAAANSVFLMTYEWGYTYGEPMAVAPVNQVRRVAEYALTRIPAEKIVLGVPNYGYDWPCPFRQERPGQRLWGILRLFLLLVSMELRFSLMNRHSPPGSGTGSMESSMRSGSRM